MERELSEAFREIYASITTVDTSEKSARYVISCSTSSGFLWQVQRSFTEFRDARSSLNKTQSKVASLPRKRMFHSSTDQEVASRTCWLALIQLLHRWCLHAQLS